MLVEEPTASREASLALPLCYRFPSAPGLGVEPHQVVSLGCLSSPRPDIERAVSHSPGRPSSSMQIQTRHPESREPSGTPTTRRTG
eukprot:scaffold2061_cov246-Pinguiococcus_pyrenoidosus.AAC.10